MRRLGGALLILSLVLTAAGCRPRKHSYEFSASTSRVEHFRQRQAATELTHGRIRLDSVEEADDGRIRYQTSDGKTWHVEMTPDPNGGYRYGIPEEAK
jgi:hypothetical protein